MKNEKYFVGLDIGTDSVGYAVTDEHYNLCKFGGEPMWGVNLFDEALAAAERRNYRSARRRLDRRQQRVGLLQELFANEISETDSGFFKRIKESYLYPEREDDKIRLFGNYDDQKAYDSKYPTIHHLIVELMENDAPHDVRLVYIACAWLVAHRGHFLSEVNKSNVDAVVDFNSVYAKLVDHITRDEYSLPWDENVNLDKVRIALTANGGIQKKTKALTEALFGGAKAPKTVSDEYEYNYELLIKLLCGGKVGLKELFDKDEYEDLEEKSVALGMDDERLATIMQSIGDDAELISVLKAVYDWSILVDVLRGEKSISQAKVAIYEQHKKDLSLLKKFVKKYVPKKYGDVFRADKISGNYASYVGKNKACGKSEKIKRTLDSADLCKYLLSVLKNVTPDDNDRDAYRDMVLRLESNTFLPKQVNGNNRVIPYQLYWYELNKILENAKNYVHFLAKTDDEGISGADKILSIFEFKIPYYVGPLKENPSKDRKINHWMVRRASGRIYPWNFDKVVDLDASENEFIARMTNSCTYLPGEDVLPKNSLVYCAFEVLNEINNIKINGNDIPIEAKQSVYENVFMHHAKVTPKLIRNHLISNGFINENDVISGLDITVKSSLKPFLQFKNLVSSGCLTYTDVENIINRATYSEDKARFKRWLEQNYPHIPESEIKYISGLKFKDFGRLSKRLLCGIEGAVNTRTGEYMSVIRTMWVTNLNLMQILHSDNFDFGKQIEEIVNEYYGAEKKSLSERLDEMHVSNLIKRPIIRTLDILGDVVKVRGTAPKRIFIEMARGTSEDVKGKRTKTRYAQILELYKQVRDEDVRRLTKQLDDMGDGVHNKLQSNKLFLYFIQLGRCLYTGKEIDINSVISGDGTYNIEHVYPRSFVKDDSVINNEILVDSKANGEKSDTYPVDATVREKMCDYWKYLNAVGLMSDEKLKRLTRSTPFTEDERFEFVNRQLVETRQSTKVIAGLLKELYPDTEIIYVKAGLVSDFRQAFDLPKSRAVNDLHHAKDAYLNIVVGNVWHSKFSRSFWRSDADNNIKPEIVFTRPVICNGKSVWNGAEDKKRVVEIARKNAVHVTRYAFCRKGGYFDQMPLSASKGLVPIKKGRPTEIYGGYNKSTATFFVLVGFKNAKKHDVMFMPVELLFADKFMRDEKFALEYAKQTVSEIINKPVDEVCFLLNKRIIKINTLLSLDGFETCITGKSSGGVKVGVSCCTNFKTSPEIEAYVKRLESFDNKAKKNTNIVFSEKYDGITKEKNIALYDHYIQKLQIKPYSLRPNNPCNILVKGREKFTSLSHVEQIRVLLSVQGLFGRAIKADLSAIGGAAASGVTTLSSSLSNWKKNYTDVRIIDQSASGLFETVSENLLDLL